MNKVNVLLEQVKYLLEDKTFELVDLNDKKSSESLDVYVNKKVDELLNKAKAGNAPVLVNTNKSEDSICSLDYSFNSDSGKKEFFISGDKIKNGYAFTPDENLTRTTLSGIVKGSLWYGKRSVR